MLNPQDTGKGEVFLLGLSVVLFRDNVIDPVSGQREPFGDQAILAALPGTFPDQPPEGNGDVLECHCAFTNS